MFAVRRVEPYKAFALHCPKVDICKLQMPTFRQSHVGSGGADRDRTGDPLLAKQVLSQLSYSPIVLLQCGGPG